jgi:CIC family chloride channel protein
VDVEPEPTPTTHAAYAVAIVLVAIGAAGLAVTVRVLLAGIWQDVYGAPDGVEAFRGLALPWRVVLPALGGLGAGAIVTFVGHQGPRGVGAVMEAVVLGRVQLSLPRALWRSAASIAAIAGGGSLGREGPMILGGGSLGASLGRRIGLSSSRVRALVAAGTGAGFAAAYNTPLAAVLFVLEVVTGIATLEAVLPTMVAVAIATAVTRALVGAGPIYGPRTFALVSAWELVAYGVLGLLAALVARSFSLLLGVAERGFERTGLSRPLRGAVGGALVGLVALRLPEVVGNGHEPLNELLDGSYGLRMVLALLLGKAVASAASVGSGSPGGVFTPTLLLGASVGLMFGHLLTDLVGVPGVGAAGGYALVGMAATSAAATHAPMMAAVLVFELSGDYAVVLPLLVATSVSTTLARRLQPASMYGAELARRGVAWELTLDGRQVR